MRFFRDRPRPNRIDFSSPPLQRATALLRVIGQSYGHALLDDRPALDLASLVEKERAWSLLLAPKHSSFAPRQASRSYSDILAGQAAGVLEGDAVRVALNHAFEQKLGGYGNEFIPADLWPLAATCAWGDLAFIHSLSSAIVEHWRSRTLLLVEYAPPQKSNDRSTFRLDLPMARLTPTLFWWLIALAEPGKTRLQRSASRAALSLLAIAIQHARVEHWAGFWDMWMLRRAAAHSSAAARIPEDMRRALEALPLGGKPVIAPEQRETPAAEPLHLAAVDWQKEMPDWFDVA